MSKNLIEKVPGGFRVDDLHLLRATCGCGSQSGPGGAGVGDCCSTYSRVQCQDRVVSFFAKAVTPYTSENYAWGYRIKKNEVEVEVVVHDTRRPKSFQFGGHYPPPLSSWQERGWEVISQFERPLDGTGEALPPNNPHGSGLPSGLPG